MLVQLRDRSAQTSLCAATQRKRRSGSTELWQQCQTLRCRDIVTVVICCITSVVVVRWFLASQQHAEGQICSDKLWAATLRSCRSDLRGQKSSLVVFGLAVHSVAGSILLWGNFLVEGIFPLELTWVQTPFPQKLSRMRV